jgi:formate--tetrahydrofolate ligase
MVCINKFGNDYKDELEYIESWCKDHKYEYAFDEGFAYGGKGSVEFAKKVVECVNKDNKFELLYKDSLSIEDKIETICKKIYGASNVVYLDKAKEDLKDIHNLKLDNYPICIAKTQSSLSDDPKLVGRPTGFTMTVREIRFSTGSEFIIPILGNMMTMPGLPKVPAANNIDIDENGIITGLF